MKILAALCLLGSLHLASTAAEQAAVGESVTLTNKELQENLGIKAWKVRIPEGYSHAAIQYIINGEVKKSGIVTDQIPIYSPDRTAIVTLREKDQFPKSYQVKISCGGQSQGEVPIPQFTEHYKKNYYLGANSGSNKNMVITDDHKVQLFYRNIVATSKEQSDLSKVVTKDFASLKVYLRLIPVRN